MGTGPGKNGIAKSRSQPVFVPVPFSFLSRFRKNSSIDNLGNEWEHCNSLKIMNGTKFHQPPITKTFQVCYYTKTMIFLVIFILPGNRSQKQDRSSWPTSCFLAADGWKWDRGWNCKNHQDPSQNRAWDWDPSWVLVPGPSQIHTSTGETAPLWFAQPPKHQYIVFYDMRDYHQHKYCIYYYLRAGYKGFKSNDLNQTHKI